jgi:HlyD family secretion protein
MRHRAAQQAPRYITEPLARGDLALTVSADGTLEPTRSVNIGSELSGTVAQVLVDVNDRVRKGQVMVELDSSKFQDQVKLSQGALDSARATCCRPRPR